MTTVTRPWQDNIMHGQSLHDAIKMLPTYLQEAVGVINIPDDNGAQLLVEEMKNTIDVHSWSDGTVKDEKGAHAFTLRPWNDDNRTSITDTAMTPSDLVSLTSLRTEYYGALGVVAIVTCLLKIHGVTELINSITHHIDSTTVRDRLNKRLNTMVMSDHILGGTDYDVWAETDALLRNPLIMLRYEHVKGHQADTLEKQHKVRGPLPRMAQYNEVCDTIAGETRMRHRQLLQTQMFSASRIALFTGRTFVTALAHGRMTEHVTGTFMEEYVHWEALERYMKGMSRSKQVKICKYMHNWQNTGRQKQKFAQSAGIDTECTLYTMQQITKIYEQNAMSQIVKRVDGTKQDCQGYAHCDLHANA